LVTETAELPEALVCDFYSIVPLGKGSAEQDATSKPKKEKARVPDRVRRVDAFSLSESAGLEFALLTGDFNPVHWIKPYARAFGFKNKILHGFATMSRTIESLRTHVWSGDRAQLQRMEVRFTRPLVLPAEVGLFVDDAGGVFVGDAPGGPAYMTGTYTTHGAADA
jgi:acyl dehydratase